ncbi:MAG: hypothetical protein IPI14_08840 [Polaromonas sp.]|nr:hypothetical protein [Polaromonas sp.]
MAGYACSGDSWKEEVMLHDGRKIIVERTVQRGGRREAGQASYQRARLTFTMPRFKATGGLGGILRKTLAQLTS